jgi:BirA family transcriptional regulator, biotin operon repressor / biotin---[acetyl-CoA-carboxylase] ligase
LPHPAINLSTAGHFQPIGHQAIELKSVDSTNNYAMAKVRAGLATHGTVFIAFEQTAGKGQRNKNWISSPGKNITLSIVLQPVFLQPQDHFALSACIALACYDFLKKNIPDELSIKWPNDLYWNDRKAGGILIESVIKGRDWLFAIAGIGINVNQSRFPESMPNPVSLKQIKGNTLDLQNLIKALLEAVEIRFTALRISGPADIINQYNQVLYKRQQQVCLRKGNIVFETIVKSVSPSGQLLTSDSVERAFEFGEVQWVS